MPRSWAVAGWKDPWSEEGCDNFGWTLWGRNIGRIWGFLNLVHRPWSGIDRGSRSHELLLSDPHLISLYRIHSVICFKDAKITPSSTFDFPDVWDFSNFIPSHVSKNQRIPAKFSNFATVLLFDFPLFPGFSMGNLRDRPKPIPFASPRRFNGEAVALAASSTKWQEGIECCREPGDLGKNLEEFGGGFMDKL